MRVLYTFGLNEDGQCGVPIRAEHNGRYFPIPVAFPSRVIISAVSAGSRHTLALTSDGDVYSWGWGHLGQLGHGDSRNVNVPTKIVTIVNATYVSAGGVHSACIDKDHYCYTWGSCTYGQLGLGKDVTETRKCIVTTPSIVTLRPDGAVKGSDYYHNKHSDSVPRLAIHSNSDKDDNMRNALRVSKVSCGGLHTAAIDLLGNVYCWGKADSGQTGYADWYQSFSAAVCCPRRVLGLGPRPRGMSIASTQSSPRRDTDRKSQQNFNENGELGPGLGIRAVDVCCGGFHTLVRMEDGSVFAMGKQDFGILGTGTEKSMSIDIGAEAPVMVRYSPGSSGKSMVDTAKPVSALQISTGGWHTAIVSAQGELFMCGKGEYGRLGLGDEKARMGLTALSSSSTVLAADGTVTSKVSVPDLTVLMQSQVEGEGAVTAAAAAAGGRDKVVQVATGGSHTIWRTEGEHLFAVGRVDGGRLGVGYISEVSLAELTILNNTGKRSMDRLLHPIDITAMLHVDQAAQFSAKGGIAESSSAANYKILQVSAGGSHSAVLVDYPDITETGAEEDFLQAIDARIQAQESKVDPKRIPKVK